MEMDDGLIAYELIFEDGLQVIVKDTTLSRAIVQACNFRYKAGASTHKELTVMKGFRRKDFDNLDLGEKPNE